MNETAELKALANELGVDLFGVADLGRLQGMAVGTGGDSCLVCLEVCPWQKRR
jgi:hypothetical protein